MAVRARAGASPRAIRGLGRIEKAAQPVPVALLPLPARHPPRPPGRRHRLGPAARPCSSGATRRASAPTSSRRKAEQRPVLRAPRVQRGRGDPASRRADDVADVARSAAARGITRERRARRAGPALHHGSRRRPRCRSLDSVGGSRGRPTPPRRHPRGLQPVVRRARWPTAGSPTTSSGRCSPRSGRSSRRSSARPRPAAIRTPGLVETQREFLERPSAMFEVLLTADARPRHRPRPHLLRPGDRPGVRGRRRRPPHLGPGARPGRAVAGPAPGRDRRDGTDAPGRPPAAPASAGRAGHGRLHRSRGGRPRGDDAAGPPARGAARRARRARRASPT